MKFASFIQIINKNSKDLFLWPNDPEMRDLFGRLIHANSFSIFECPEHYLFDLDDCYFQFKGMKRKIKHNNLHKYNVEIMTVGKS